MPDVVYDAILGSGVPLKQVTQSSFEPHTETMAGRMSGSGVISDQFVTSVHPEASLTTLDLAGFMAAFGTVGTLIADGSTTLIPWQKRASGGTFSGGTSNFTVAGISNCPVLLVPESITCPRVGAPHATGKLIYLSSDGKLCPFVESINQSLSSQAFAALFGMGPVFINTVHVPRMVGYTINFGIGLSERQNYDGAVYPSDIFIETFDPTVEIQVEDFDQFSSMVPNGVITGFTAYMRKRASGSTYVADATAQHVKLSFSSGIIKPQAISANETKHGSGGIRVEARSLTVSTASAVTSP